jgi:hypothetical protein
MAVLIFNMLLAYGFGWLCGWITAADAAARRRRRPRHPVSPMPGPTTPKPPIEPVGVVFNRNGYPIAFQPRRSTGRPIPPPRRP